MIEMNPKARIDKLLANGRRETMIAAALRYNAQVVKMTHDYGHLRNKPNMWHQSFHDRYWLVNLFADAFVEDAKIFLKRNLFGLVFDNEIMLYVRKTNFDPVYPGHIARTEGTTIREIRHSSNTVVAKTLSGHMQFAIDGLGLDDTILLIYEPFEGLYPIRMEYKLLNGQIIRLDFIDQNYRLVIAVETVSDFTGGIGAADGDSPQFPSPIAPTPKNRDLGDDSLSKEG